MDGGRREFLTAAASFAAAGVAISEGTADAATPLLDGNTTTIQLRRGTAAQTTSDNPTLAAGEVGVETDTGKFKIGDGSTAWTELPYATDLSRLPPSVVTGGPTPEQFGAVADGVADDTQAVQHAIDASVNTRRAARISAHHQITAPLTIPAGCPGIYLAEGSALYRKYASDVSHNGTATSGALIRNADFTTPLDGFSITGPGKIVNSQPATYVGRVLALWCNALLLDDFTVDGWDGSIFAILAGDRMRIGPIRVLNGGTGAGVDGIRYVGGRGFRCVGAHIDSGDSTFGFVPIPPGSTDLLPGDMDIEDAIYIGCTGSCAANNLLQVSLHPFASDQMTCSITNSGFIGCTGDGGADGAMRAQNRGSTGEIDTFFTDCKVERGSGPGTFRVDMQTAFGGLGAMRVTARGIKAEHVAITGNATNPVDYVHIGDAELTNYAPTVTYCNDFSLNGSQPTNTQTGTAYTLTLADAGKLITVNNANAATLTVDKSANVGFPIGTIVDLARLGMGAVQVVGATGVTITAPPGAFLRTLGSSGKLQKIGTDTWLLSGDLSGPPDPSGSPQFRSAATSLLLAAATTAGTVTTPAGVVTGDQILVAANLARGNTTDAVATPTGWSLVAGPVGTGDTGGVTCYLFSRTVDGSEGASLAFTKSGTNAAWRLTATAWRNTAGVEISASNNSGAVATKTPTLPSVTPTVDNSALVGVLCIRANLKMTSIAQFLQAIDSRTSDAINPCTSFVYRTPVAAGASGTANPTLSSTTQWVTFSVVLKHV